MSSLACVDASLVVRVLVPGQYSDRALDALAGWQEDGTQLVAPALLAFEVTSVLRRLVHLRELTAEEGDQALEGFLRLDVRLLSRRGIFPLAWRLARELNQPRAYDVSYLAVGLLLGCEFWTADERLYNIAGKRYPFVRWIGASPSP